MSDRQEGWGFPTGSRKAHYFVRSESLCRRWGLYFGVLEPDTGKASPDDCAACRQAFEKRGETQ